MSIEEALVILETVLEQKRLSRIQELVFRQAWEGLSYSEIAENCGYDPDYLKNVGAKLWRVLSKTFGEKVTKSNVRSVLARQPYRIRSPIRIDSQLPTLDISHRDWGDARDTFLFYGRSAELTTLKQWVVEDCCRLVTLWGLSGVGKTALAVKLAQQVEHQFKYLIWRSFCHAPPLSEFLLNLLQFLDTDNPNDLPNNTNEQIARLIELLQKQRCLLIIDGVESIFGLEEKLENNCLTVSTQKGERNRNSNDFICSSNKSDYLNRYQDYSELFIKIAKVSHQSCLILTSRKELKLMTKLAANFLSVRSLRLKGIVIPDEPFTSNHLDPSLFNILLNNGLVTNQDPNNFITKH